MPKAKQPMTSQSPRRPPAHLSCLDLPTIFCSRSCTPARPRHLNPPQLQTWRQHPPIRLQIPHQRLRRQQRTTPHSPSHPTTPSRPSFPYSPSPAHAAPNSHHGHRSSSLIADITASSRCRSSTRSTPHSSTTPPSDVASLSATQKQSSCTWPRRKAGTGLSL